MSIQMATRPITYVECPICGTDVEIENGAECSNCGQAFTVKPAEHGGFVVECTVGQNVQNHPNLAGRKLFTVLQDGIYPEWLTSHWFNGVQSVRLLDEFGEVKGNDPHAKEW